MDPIYWRVYFKRKYSELNGSVWGCGREFGSFAFCYSFLCLVWMRAQSKSNQTISWTVNWLKSRIWQSRVFVWSPLFTKTCRFFPIADVKNLVETDQLEWWLIICLRGIAICQHFSGWNKGESFKLFHCYQWIEVFSLVFSFVGRKPIFQLLFMCSVVSGCAQAKQILSSHIFFPTLTLPSSTLCCSFVVVTSQLISPTSVTVRLASSLPS